MVATSAGIHMVSGSDPSTGFNKSHWLFNPILEGKQVKQVAQGHGTWRLWELALDLRPCVPPIALFPQDMELEFSCAAWEGGQSQSPRIGVSAR